MILARENQLNLQVAYSPRTLAVKKVSWSCFCVKLRIFVSKLSLRRWDYFLCFVGLTSEISQDFFNQSYFESKIKGSCSAFDPSIFISYSLDVSKHGILEVDGESGQVTSLVEKPSPDETASRKAVRTQLISQMVV